MIEEGGVLSVPVKEFRMTNPPKLNRSGYIEFVEKKGKGAKNLIEYYPISQTITNLNEQIPSKYNEEI